MGRLVTYLYCYNSSINVAVYIVLWLLKYPTRRNEEMHQNECEMYKPRVFYYLSQWLSVYPALWRTVSKRLFEWQYDSVKMVCCAYMPRLWCSKVFLGSDMLLGGWSARILHAQKLLSVSKTQVQLSWNKSRKEKSSATSISNRTYAEETWNIFDLILINHANQCWRGFIPAIM